MLRGDGMARAHGVRAFFWGGGCASLLEVNVDPVIDGAVGLVARGSLGVGARRRRRRRANLVSSVVSAKPAEWLDVWEWHWERLVAARVARHRMIAARAPAGSLRTWHERRAHGLAAHVDEVVGRCRRTLMEMGCACNSGGSELGAVSAVRPVGCGRRLVCRWCARQAARRLGRRVEETVRTRVFDARRKWEAEGARGMAPTVYLITMGVRHRATLTESAAALDRAWRVFSSRIACEESEKLKALWRRAYAGLGDAGQVELREIEALDPKRRSVAQRTRRKRLRWEALETLSERDRAWVRSRETEEQRGARHWVRSSCAVLEVAAGSAGEGHIHVHCVTVARWVDVKMLREQWTRATCEECSSAGVMLDVASCECRGEKATCRHACKHGGASASPVVHLRRWKGDPAASAASAAAYVAKYIAKGVEVDGEGDVELSPKTYAEVMAVHVGRRMLRTSRGWWLYSEEEAQEYGLAPSGRNEEGGLVWLPRDRRRWSPSVCMCCEGPYHLVTPPPPVMLASPGMWISRWARSMGPIPGTQVPLGPPAYQRDDGEWVRWS